MEPPRLCPDTGLLLAVFVSEFIYSNPLLSFLISKLGILSLHTPLGFVMFQGKALQIESGLSKLPPPIKSHCASMLSLFGRVWLFVTLWTIARQAPLFMGFSSKNTGVDCHTLFQEIFPTQGLNLYLLCFLHWQAGSLPLAPPGKPTPSL